MKFRNTFLYLIATSISLISFAQNKESQKQYIGITITGRNIFSKFGSCDINANKYFKDYLGLKISSDFQILDSIRINANDDGIPDYVVVLSPVIQEEELFGSFCYKQSYNHRLLLILNSSTNGYIVHTVGENVIVNKSEYQSEPFRKLLSTKDGFGLSFFIGSVNKCYYDFFFKKNNGNYYLDSSFYNCYKVDLSANDEKKRTYQLSDSTAIEKIDIRKYLVIPNM
jgi:hypothetical protein